MIRFYEYLEAIHFTSEEYDRLSYHWRYIIYQMFCDQLIELIGK